MAEWHCIIDGQKQGPISADQLRQWAKSGRLKPDDKIWREGLPDWVPASRVKGLFPDAAAPAAGPSIPVERAAPAPQRAATADASAPALSLSTMRTPGEGVLRVICLIVTVVFYLVLIVATRGVGIVLIGGFLLLNYVALAVMLAQIRGNGIKVGPDQLPKVYESARRASAALGLREVPEVYVVQQGGMLNAFATKWAFRRYVVVFSDLIDACGDDSVELDMILSHEIGHLALGHITWLWILLPAHLVPFLSQGYSRACEYSCDRCGMAGCGNAEGAMRGLLVLAAGGNCARMASLEAFLRQRDTVRGFWQTVVEWVSTHPWLTRRVEALHLSTDILTARQSA